MTGPVTLTDEQRAVVKAHATAAALNYHDTQLPAIDRVDLNLSYFVHRDLNLVAADVLEAACFQASKGAATGSGGIKRVKIEGEVEVEKFASTSVDSVTAASWGDRAARLRKEATALPCGPQAVPSPLAAGRSGSNPNPVFCITRPPGEELP